MCYSAPSTTPVPTNKAAPFLVVNDFGTLRVIKTDLPIHRESQCRPLPKTNALQNLTDFALGYVNGKLWACGGYVEREEPRRECYTYEHQVSVIYTYYQLEAQ